MITLNVQFEEHYMVIITACPLNSLLVELRDVIHQALLQVKSAQTTLYEGLQALWFMWNNVFESSCFFY
jgi:hypothetical protein